MADEAFALSPISARASMPREEDYEAISEAFMETSRGRWFLGEYAKRNRNADTRMVLDAVARIEHSLAAQRQPAPDSGLAEALAAIRSALDEARAAASVALDSLALEEHLAPVRKGARVIREISWRWREIGADGRICDLLDSQVGAIEGACGQLSSVAPRDALSAAFDLIGQRIAGFDDGELADPQAEQAIRPTSPSHFSAPSDEMPAAAAQAPQTATATDDTAAVMSTPAERTEAGVAAAQAIDLAAEAADVAAEVAEITSEAADAHDEAVLDMVALAMAAPDAFDSDEASDPDADEIHVAELPADPVMVAPEAEPMAAPAQPLAIQPSLQPSLEPSPEPSLEPSPKPLLEPSLEASREPSLEPSREASLGSSLIASGIVRRPNASVSNPLAPIRRMSQAEKIALFS